MNPKTSTPQPSVNSAAHPSLPKKQKQRERTERREGVLRGPRRGGELKLSGLQFGKLTALRKDGKTKWGAILWICECSCGKLCQVTGSRLVNGTTSSCGCWVKERATTHGLSQTYFERIRAKMISRCYNKSDKDYPNYGGRGIRVCCDWLSSLELFAKGVGQRPTEKHQLDRYPNNDGNYEPGNVRWATAKQQAWNRRTNATLALPEGRVRLLEYSGAVPSNIIRVRVRSGWSVERATSVPVAKRTKRK